MKKPSLFVPGFLVGLFTIVLFVGSCKKEFDVNSDWKEIMIVYGLLNPDDSVQYIKINKAFLGKGNANDMALVADSFNYKPGEIQAVLQRKSSSGEVLESYVLEYDTAISKRTGTFANYPNVLYRLNRKVEQDGSTYSINITNLNTGKIASSSTNIVGDIALSSPNPNALLDWVNNYDKPKAPFKVKWDGAPNGKIYQLTIRFHYSETSKLDTSVKSNVYADWVFDSKSATGSSGSLAEDIYGIDFFKFVAAKVAVNNAVNRKAIGLEFIFSIGAEELYNYIEVSKASYGIVQEKPAYSNLEGAYGLFSSRGEYHTPIIRFSPATITALQTYSYTSNLGF